VSHATLASPDLDFALEPGDRIEGAVEWSPPRLVVSPVAWAAVAAAHEIEAPSGELVDAFPDDGSLQVPRLAEFVPAGVDMTWLEVGATGRWRLVLNEAPARRDTEDQGSEDDPAAELAIDPADNRLLRAALCPAASLPDVHLALRAVRLATHGGFDKLICLPLVRDMDILEHQVRTAITVLRRLRGRALLCDEVGLGKTIEAGLVLSELATRGLARSVLVLTPPSLVEQWQGELRRKFSLDFTAYDDPAFRDDGPEAWSRHDRVIASLSTAKREPHRGVIRARKWDLVIIDEAHHLRNRSTQAWKFASELEKQYILLLTATPVQNNLEELFNLVTLLEPGLLSTSRQFQKRFVDKRDKLTPVNVDELHGLLAEVMVRNRRNTVGLHFTRRYARTLRVRLSPAEQQLYDDAAAYVRQRLRGDDRPLGLNRMALLALQMALGSSSQAAAGTLGRLAEQPRLPAEDRARLAELAARADAERSSAKTDQLLALLEGSDDKLVVFTQFRATQEMLHERLLEAGHDAAVFHGGLSRLQKEEAVRTFRGRARLLLCTEAGSEGRNLQFAHAVCNFDLPWNPMKIEQRVGRLSRIGQTRDVQVVNLAAAGTVEDAVLHLLEAKLNMFELVIGEIDMILGNLEDADDKEFEDVVADLWAGAADAGDFACRMEELGNRLVAAKEAYFRQRAHDDKLFGNRFSPDG
jgi:SNF2 family DNA or RNA helicase